MVVSALDENGKAVDWWFMYKVPKMAKDAFAFAPPADAKEDQPEDPEGLLAVGSAAPEFEASKLDGAKLKLSDFKGRTVLLNFWFST